MKKKKAIKRLQALGVQRNDAAGFVAAYRAIEAAGKLGYIPGIMEPPRRPQFTSSPYEVQTMATTLRVPDTPDLIHPALTEDIHARLARELGMGLLNAGAIAIRARPVPYMDVLGAVYGVEYTATVNVAMRRENA